MRTASSFLKHHGIALLLAAALVLVTSLTFLFPSTEFSTSMTEMLIRVVIVVGLAVFIGNSGVISFGHIAFCCIGAYAAAWLNAEPTFKQIMLSGLPDLLQKGQFGFIPSLLAGGALAALFAFLVGVAVMRLSGIAASIATFATLIVVNNVYSNWDSVTGGVSSIIGIPTVVGPWTACAVALCALVVAHLFHGSRTGLMLRATRDDEVAARAAGISIVRVRLVAFVISAAIVGIAGALYAHFLGILTTDVFYLDLAFITLAMLVIGGVAHPGGAIAGVLFVSFVIENLRGLERGVSFGDSVVKLPNGIQEIGLGLILALILIFSPRGIASQIGRLWLLLAGSKGDAPSGPGV